MSYQKESFGMMDEGYFVSRSQILDWINNLLELNITKIQQLGAGSVYCQIVDVIHPGKVSMSKVNWKAKNDYEFISNLKILQNAFDKVGVKRHVEVEKLARAKYQDNLEFIQWLKRYYDLNCGDRGNGYNAVERRGNCKIDTSFADKIVVPKQFNAKGQIVQTKVQPPTKSENYTDIIYKNPRKQMKPPKMQSPPKKTEIKNWQKLYENEKSKCKNFQIQMSMIFEILQSKQESDVKIAMIQETLSSNTNQIHIAENEMQIEKNEQEYNI